MKTRTPGMQDFHRSQREGHEPGMSIPQGLDVPARTISRELGRTPWKAWDAPRRRADTLFQQ